MGLSLKFTLGSANAYMVAFNNIFWNTFHHITKHCLKNMGWLFKEEGT